MRVGSGCVRFQGQRLLNQNYARLYSQTANVHKGEVSDVLTIRRTRDVVRTIGIGRRLGTVSHMSADAVAMRARITQNLSFEQGKTSSVSASVLCPLFFSTKLKEMQTCLDHLPVVRGIHEAFAESGVAVVCGAPGTAKTEQIYLALNSSALPTFDLKDAFLNDYFETHGITDKETQDQIWNEGYYQLKDQELAWLTENYTEILNSLVHSEGEHVLLDEFDMGGSTTLNPTEAKTAGLIMKLASDLRKNDKKPALVIHNTGLNTPELMKEMTRRGIGGPSKVVHTGPIPEENQRELLTWLGFEPQEINGLISLCEGHPALLLGVFEECAAQVGRNGERALYRPNLTHVLEDATKSLAKTWKVTKRVCGPDIVADLVQYGHDNKAGRATKADSELGQGLLRTGLVYKEDGVCKMSRLARWVIEDAEREVNLKEVTEYLKAVDKGGESLSPPMRAAHEHAQGLGGAVLFELADGQVVSLPSNVALVRAVSHIHKSVAASLIRGEKLPQERDSNEHWLWKNSADTVEGLLADATKAKPMFVDMVNKYAEQSSSRAFMGEGNKYVMKSAESITEKRDRWAQSGNPADVKKALQSINDPLRATLICPSFGSLQEAMATVYETCQALGHDVVFSNKVEEDYNSNYVGVHAKVRMHITDPASGEKRTLMSEIQFHGEDIHGEGHSVKEEAHTVYTKTRSDGKKLPTAVQKALDDVSANLFASGINNWVSPKRIGHQSFTLVDPEIGKKD